MEWNRKFIPKKIYTVSEGKVVGINKIAYSQTILENKAYVHSRTHTHIYKCMQVCLYI